MAITSNLRRQHSELLELSQTILSHLDARRLSEDDGSVARLLPVFVGKLRVHLAAEDKALYPQLFKHENEAIRTAAKDFSAGIVPLSIALKEYIARWLKPGAIQGDPALFIDSTKALFAALLERMKNEDSVLYRMLEGLE